ncbi:MAG TPA: VOC family protein [bacterium]|nr:VOC family protein [bacterium]
MTGEIPPLGLPRINQIGYVVRDLDASVRAYAHRLGVGGWQLYTYGPSLVPEMTYRGRAQAYRMRLAFTWWGDLQLELVEPLEGPSVYEDFLRAHGEGIHHLGVFVPDFAAAVRAMEQRGYQVIQSGRGFGARGDGAYAYFDTAASLATLLEVIQVPAERHPPESVYPP